MKTNTKKTLRIYWQACLKHRASGLAVVLGVVGASFLGVIIPLFYKNFFDVLASGEAPSAVVKNLISILLTIAGLEVISWLVWRLATFTNSYFQPKAMAELTNQCFAYLHRHSFGFFNNSFVGSLVKRVQWFVRAFETIADRFTWNILPLVVNISVIIVVLFYLNFYLGLGVAIWLAIFLTINAVFVRYKLKYDIKRSAAETETSKYLADTITNQSSVKLFNGYGQALKDFSSLVEVVRRLRLFTWNLDNAIDAFQGLMMVFLEIGILFLAINLWQQGIISLGAFVLIQTYLMNIFNRVWDFGRFIRDVCQNLADAEEMTVILNTLHEIQDAPGAKKLEVGAGRIEFKNVSFNYSQARNILNDFNLAIKPGERIALIGPSGAGKTTVVKLLLRMHDLSAGEILIDGQNISQVTQESLWQDISFVPQDPVLFHRPIIENIRYGKAKASDEAVIKAAKLAHCNEFISGLVDGYDTYVGERGIKLSGGERQRVAIARAILKNSPILVLDEATSSLDSESERLIQDGLDKLMKGKTVIVIAHRLSTIRKMDRIIVIDEGGIIEQGTHQQLNQLKAGLYRKLWELQAGGFS